LGHEHLRPDSGAGGAAGYWHRVIPPLREAGHDAIAVGLPGPDPRAGLPEYSQLVVSAIDGREDVVLVAASIGGFTAPERSRAASTWLPGTSTPGPSMRC